MPLTAVKTRSRPVTRVTQSNSAEVLALRDPSPQEAAEFLANRNAAALILRADDFIHSRSSIEAIAESLQGIKKEFSYQRKSSDPEKLKKMLQKVVDFLAKKSVGSSEDVDHKFTPLRNAAMDLINFMTLATDGCALTLRIDLKRVGEHTAASSGQIHKGPLTTIPKPFARLHTGAGYDVFAPKDVQIHLSSPTDLGIPANNPIKMDAFDIIVGHGARLGRTVDAPAVMIPGPLLRERLDAVGTMALRITVYADAGTRFTAKDLNGFQFKTH